MLAALALAAVRDILGLLANALLNNRFTKLLFTLQADVVVRLINPAVSVPLTVTAASEQFCISLDTVGALPPLTMCPFTVKVLAVRLPVTERVPMVASPVTARF